MKKRENGYDVIRAVAMLLILIFHINTTIKSMLGDVSFSLLLDGSGILNLGAIGVVLFFALSGALLARNYCGGGNFSVLGFYKKRLLKIVVPHMIAYVLMFIACYIIQPDWISSVPVPAIICSFLGLDYFNEAFFARFGYNMLWIVGEWFTTVIIILYLIFPLLRLCFKKIPIISSIIVLTIFLVNLRLQLITYGGGAFSITNGLFAFWVGMLIDKYKDKIFTKNIFAPLICLTICAVLLIINPTKMIFSSYLIVVLFSFALFVVLLNCDFSSKTISYLGKYNFEAYLVHHRYYILLLPLILSANSSTMQYLLTIVFFLFTTYKIAEILQKLVNKIYSLFEKKETKKKFGWTSFFILLVLVLNKQMSGFLLFRFGYTQ